MEEEKKFIRMSQLQQKLGGISRSTVYGLMKRGVLPKSITLSKTLVVWDEQEVDSYLSRCK
ncbi:MAG: helix-turn-helix transcriptional regulator [Alphaproteobacteria bacterium]